MKEEEMLPKTLRIKGHDYRMDQVPSSALPDDIAADCDNVANRIRIVASASNSRKIELVFHETLHAMLAGYDTPAEEVLVVTLGESLTAFIRDNPEFIRHALKVLGQP